MTGKKGNRHEKYSTFFHSRCSSVGLYRWILGAFPCDRWDGGAEMKSLHNANGKIYAQIDDDGVLRKCEKQCDRLRISGGREHALDETLLQEALRLGVKRLEIRERGNDGGSRLWKIALDDLLRYGKRRRLAGVERRTIPLLHCELVSGEPEEWYTAARSKYEKRRVKEVLGVQGMLFGLTPLERMFQHETD